MNEEQNMMQSIQNVRELAYQSKQLLKETDRIMEKNGYEPLRGTRVYAKWNDNLNERYQENRSFLPPFMARYYILSDGPADKNRVTIFGITVQLYHASLPDLPPLFIGGRIEMDHVPGYDREIESHWLKAALLDREHRGDFTYDETFYKSSRVVEKEDLHNVTAEVMATSLLSIQSVEEIERFMTLMLTSWQSTK
ncbi:hypothetical protein [Salsuginibacillus kocurii]|uniref:hypothetical protein n=1 Tax=Salsuginibacillus kocurii TaxID=427078 RepID=UPI0003709E61|nr:hypothetical protein [Salsuginibacillus kocurii]